MENQDDLQLGGADETTEAADLNETADGQEKVVETDDKADPLDAVTDIEELRKFAKAERAKAFRRNKPKEETQQAKPVAQKTAPTDDIDSILTLQAEGRTPAEIKSLREYSRKMGKTIQEVANDPVIKAGFDALRQKTQTENAIPSPSKRAPTFKGKTLTETVLTGSPADVQAAIEQTLASKLRPKAND